MPLAHTFIRLLDEGPHTDNLLDELQIRLTGRAVVGRLAVPEAIPVIFFDDPPVEEQHAVVTAALDAVDKAADRLPGEWKEYLGVVRT
jgi:hypothetical protein